MGGERAWHRQIESCDWIRSGEGTDVRNRSINEGAPELLGSCCCAVDRAWFASFRPDALRFEMRASRAQGDSVCVLSVTPR